MLDFMKSHRMANGSGLVPEVVQPHSCRQIRSELQRVLGSPQFDASERNRRFLEYVVEETLMGRDSRIKAYSIATIVFGRGDSFDPTLDPVVRMEARRLRRSLERFYLVEGDGDAVRISLPKGGYVPRFQSASRLRPMGFGMPGNADGGARHAGPTILVCPFELEFKRASDVNYSDGLARQIVVGLSRIPELGVYMPSPLPGWNGHVERSAANAADIDLVLTGNTALRPHMLNVKATLLDGQSGRVLWAQTFASEVATQQGVLDARDDIADRIVRALSARFTGTAQAAFDPHLPDQDGAPPIP